MSLDNLTIPAYWTKIGTGDVYKITMIEQNTNPIQYRLRMCDSKCSADDTSYESAKKDLFEIRNVINTCSNFSPVFQEIKEYCIYLVNIGITSEDFIKKDFRTIM